MANHNLIYQIKYTDPCRAAQVTKKPGDKRHKARLWAPPCLRPHVLKKDMWNDILNRTFYQP